MEQQLNDKKFIIKDNGDVDIGDGCICNGKIRILSSEPLDNELRDLGCCEGFLFKYGVNLRLKWIDENGVIRVTNNL